VLTTFDADENMLRALRAGASGFLLKDSPPGQIAEAIRRVAAGDPILSPKITRRLMDRAAEADAQERAQLALRTLSPREHEVVLAIARGHTNAEIATELYMSVPTVKAHITHILTKLGLGTGPRSPWSPTTPTSRELPGSRQADRSVPTVHPGERTTGRRTHHSSRMAISQ
jgi:DNA-binding NarL/FixJ family response regulator